MIVLPFRASTICFAISFATLSCASVVLAPKCGVHKTLGCLTKSILISKKTFSTLFQTSAKKIIKKI